ncbi:MAG TPA: hypothetical protein VGM34_03370 [Chlamydiales bacterium]|jgi:hypothetical protein
MKVDNYLLWAEHNTYAYEKNVEFIPSIKKTGFLAIQFVISATALPFLLLSLIYQRIAGEESSLREARGRASDHGRFVFVTFPTSPLILIFGTKFFYHAHEATSLLDTELYENSHWISLKIRWHFLAQIIGSAVYFPFCLLNDLYQRLVANYPHDHILAGEHFKALLTHTICLVTPLSNLYIPISKIQHALEKDVGERYKNLIKYVGKVRYRERSQEQLDARTKLFDTRLKALAEIIDADDKQVLEIALAEKKTIKPSNQPPEPKSPPYQITHGQDFTHPIYQTDLSGTTSR